MTVSDASWALETPDKIEEPLQDWQLASRPPSPPSDVPSPPDGSDWRHIVKKQDASFSTATATGEDEEDDHVAALRLYAELEGRPFVRPTATASELESLAGDLAVQAEEEDDDDESETSNDTLLGYTEDVPPTSEALVHAEVQDRLDGFRASEARRMLGFAQHDEFHRSALVAFFVKEGFARPTAEMLAEEIDGHEIDNGLFSAEDGTWQRVKSSATAADPTPGIKLPPLEGEETIIQMEELPVCVPAPYRSPTALGYARLSQQRIAQSKSKPKASISTAVSDEKTEKKLAESSTTSSTNVAIDALVAQTSSVTIADGVP